MAPGDIERRLAPLRTHFVAAAEDLTRRNSGPKADPHLVDATVTSLLSVDQTMVIDEFSAALHNVDRIATGLAELAIPKVAINSDHRPNDLDSFAAHGVRHLLMPGVGHFLMSEDPDRLNGLLAEGVAGILAAD